MYKFVTFQKEIYTKMNASETFKYLILYCPSLMAVAFPQLDIRYRNSKMQVTRH